MKKIIILSAIAVMALFLSVASAQAAGRCYADTSASCSTSGAFSQCRTCEVCDDGSPSSCHSMQVCSGCMTDAQKDDLATRRAICLCNHPNDYLANCGNIQSPRSESTGGMSLRKSREICATDKTSAPATIEFNGIEFKK